MLRIITLLTQRNHYLEKFYALNETETERFYQHDFDGLDQFYQDREKILEIIRYLDSEIELTKDQDHMVTEDHRLEIKVLISVKAEYVGRILKQDLEVLACIEHEKSLIIRELQDIKHNKKAVSSYKSKTFSNRLNEKF